MAKRPVKTHVELMGVISISWDSRRKDWLLEISSKQQGRSWYWWLRADTSSELDEGTGWLLLEAVRAALEAQLF